MELQEVMEQLAAKSNASVRAHNTKYGAGSNQFGVKMGDIRAIAAKIKTDHLLSLELWATGNVEARFLATLIMKPTLLTREELNMMVKSERFVHVADWLYSNVIKAFPGKDDLREPWMNDPDVMCARAGWSLTATIVSKKTGGMDLKALLDRIDAELAYAAEQVQWTMNMTLAQIGINYPEFRERCLEIGERLGVYRDFPVSKGCTSPFAPIWINAMVKRQG